MGKKSPKSPAPPDPVAVAQAQQQANTETARVNFANSAVNQYTPYGSLVWNQIAPDRWSATQTLSPEQSWLKSQEENLGMTMNDMAQRSLWRADATLSTPFNDAGIQQAGYRLDPNWAIGWRGTPQETANLGVENVAPRDTSEVARLMMQRAAPDLQRNRNAIRNQLINSGVREGTEAWNRAMDDYNRQYNDATIAAQLAAGQEQGRQFQQDLAASQYGVGQKQWNANQQFAQAMDAANFQNNLRNQQMSELMTLSDRDTAERQRQIAERAYFRQLPLNEITALMSGSQLTQPNFVNTPQFNASPADYMGAAYQNYAGQQSAYNMQMQNSMANRAGIYGLLGQGLGIGAFGLAGGFSDERLKRDIVRIGHLPSGLPLYSFRFVWEPESVRRIGVMAQEVLKVFPKAVASVGGWLMVNYAAIR